MFTENVTANYSSPLGLLTPLSAVKEGLERFFAPVDAQHAHGTQVVEISGACEARSVSYFTATHFGRGKYYGEVRVVAFVLFRCAFPGFCLLLIPFSPPFPFFLSLLPFLSLASEQRHSV